MSYPALFRECDSSCWVEGFCVIQPVFVVHEKGNWSTPCVRARLVFIL